MKLGLVLLAVASLACERQTSPSLELKGRQLVLVRHGGAVPIRTFRDPDELQGFGLLDESHAFLAYAGSGEGGASTVLAFFDAETKQEKRFYELGATGASSFVYNPKTRTVGFNWYNGLYTFSVSVVADMVAKGHSADFESALRRVSDALCDEPRWESASVLTCTSREEPRRLLRVPIGGN